MRRYLFVCDSCRTQKGLESETLPEGWVIVVVRGRAYDLCSPGCASVVLSLPPPAPSAGALPPKL